MPVQQIDWDLALIQRYNYSGPRYTSYPTTSEFSGDFGEQAFLQIVTRYPERPLSPYIYIPFCHKLCYFCGCNKIVTRQQYKANQCLNALEQEIAYRAPLFAGRHISQLHWSGGTPTYLNKTQVSRLVKLLRESFQFNTDAEISIEVDPRETGLDVLDHLRAEGSNRLSMGVRDLNKEIQHLVGRKQDEELTLALLSHARETGFTFASIDPIYGLPKWTPGSFVFTLKCVTELNPDRLSVFNYAHLPTVFAVQHEIKDAGLPSPQQELDTLQEAIVFPTQSDYQFIGIDHFARSDDELAMAQHEGVLHRSFQGYTIQGSTDLLGMSVSATNMIGGYYVQNRKELKQYYQQTDEQDNTLWRGITLTHGDCIRRDVIKLLICDFRLDHAPIEKQRDLHSADHFAEDFKLLAPLAEDRLVGVDGKRIQVTMRGRLLIRNTRMCFDTYPRQKARIQQLSWAV